MQRHKHGAETILERFGRQRKRRGLRTPWRRRRERRKRVRAKRELSNDRANRYPERLRGKAQNASECLVAKLSESRMRRYQGKTPQRYFSRNAQRESWVRIESNKISPFCIQLDKTHNKQTKTEYKWTGERPTYFTQELLQV